MENSEEIQKAKLEYLDKEVFELVSAMEVIDDIKEKQQIVASVAAMNFITLDTSPIGDTTESQGDMIYVIRDGKKTGFNHNTGKRFTNFLTTINRIPKVHARVSASFTKEITLKWLVETKLSGRANSNFSSHLLSSIDGEIGRASCRERVSLTV